MKNSTGNKGFRMKESNILKDLRFAPKGVTTSVAVSSDPLTYDFQLPYRFDNFNYAVSTLVRQMLNSGKYFSAS